MRVSLSPLHSERCSALVLASAARYALQGRGGSATQLACRITRHQRLEAFLFSLYAPAAASQMATQEMCSKWIESCGFVL